MFFKTVYDLEAPETLQDDSLKRYCGAFDKNISIETYREIIEDVEETYIMPHLGSAFYDELLATYATHLSGGTPDASQLALIRKLQKPIAYFTLFEAIAGRSIFVSDMGPGQSVSKDGTYIFPSKWRAQSGLRKSFQTANRRLDRALEYLDENVDNFTTFKNSITFSDSRKFFFNSPKELELFLPMEASRVVFNTIKPVINEAEQRYIYRLIGEGLFSEMKTAILNNNLTSDQEDLLEKIRWALSRWIRIFAIPNLRLRINETSLVEPDFNADGADNQVQPASEEVVRSLWVNDMIAGREFLNELKSWLWQNASKFPTFEASDLYDKEEPKTAFLDEFNKNSSGIGSLL